MNHLKRRYIILNLLRIIYLYLQKKKKIQKKVEQDISTKKNVVQKYTDKDVEAFKKITAESQKDNSSKLYTKKDFSIFNNILNKENNIDKKNQLKI